jgi:ATP-dependent DNA helicase DinG
MLSDTLADLPTEIAALFAERGPLSGSVAGYRVRAQQVEMAQRVAQALVGARTLIAEAGTGTGKTFAYLAPALLHGGKVIISTGTKTLQDQLFHRDIPAVRAALRAPVTIALLKGRANYVCHHYLDRALGEAQLPSRDEVRYLGAIERFARQSVSGDKSELASVPETAAVWNHVTSTRENCLGQECGYYKECFVMRARREAMHADVVVVNHHLFFADVMLRDTGMAELLPACNTVIFDEAHQLPAIASLFFGQTLSSTQLLELARDARAEQVTSAKEATTLAEACDALENAARKFRLAAGEERGAGNAPRTTVRRWQADDALAAELEHVRESVRLLEVQLAAQAERSEGLQNCQRRAAELLARVQAWHEPPAQEHVRWIETFSHSVQLHMTPLSVAEPFRAQLTSYPRAWVFTSATLSMAGDFSHYQAQLGLEGAQTAAWDSPFDYRQQAVLYLPEDMVEPNSREHTEAVVRSALPVVRAAGGRTFLLFTTLRAMRHAHELLAAAFEREGLDYPLLVQGAGTRSELLERFRALGNAVLVGSHSFWEGVDVRGRALSVVVIDKLPFAPPDDPVVAARLDALRTRGGNPFMEYQLPEAVITLKQGAGRLIRDETDRGVLMICDVRLVSKGYGRGIVRALPPMRATRRLQNVLDFFAQRGDAQPAVAAT